MLPTFSMGSCLCKQKRRRRGEESPSRSGRRGRNCSHAQDSLEGRRRLGSNEIREMYRRMNNARLNTSPYDESSAARQSLTMMDRDIVSKMIEQTLYVIRTLVNNDQEPPTSLLRLNLIADKEDGWQLVVNGLIDQVPDEDALGPAVITLFLDECPLPAKEAICNLLSSLNLHSPHFDPSKRPGWHKNVCIVLGSLAEKLAGVTCIQICSPKIVDYLIGNLKTSLPKQVILFSLLALEKFAQTTENRITIMQRFDEMPDHPLEKLERWLRDKKDTDYLAQQVGFCAQWSLDNIFAKPNRTYAYEKVNVSGINAMLNHQDVSEYLKIGPDGLEARCDVSSFESVRCTFEVVEGVWYYEATVLTPGVMQIGFATKRSLFLNHEGYGIGDDDLSVAYDGCRQLLWHNANCTRHEHDPWKAGDVVGCLLDITNRSVTFFLNGVSLRRPHTEFLDRKPDTDGVFAAASFMSFQQCRFNFGSKPFKFPPPCVFSVFNEGGSSLTEEQRTILPRRRRMEELQRVHIPDDLCNICYSRPPIATLQPCGHDGFCDHCALQMEICPLCRRVITERQTISIQTNI